MTDPFAEVSEERQLFENNARSLIRHIQEGEQRYGVELGPSSCCGCWKLTVVSPDHEQEYPYVLGAEAS